MLTLNLALNKFAFHWSYPEILAEELGLFAREGVDLHWFDTTPKKVVSKTRMYIDLLKERKTDIYHAGEWVCINRVAKSPGTWIIAKSPTGEGTLNSSFALYVKRDSLVESPGELAGRTVAIEDGTGAQFTAINDLEAHMPRDQIKLVQVGEPHRRLLALLDGQVEAASLLGPWSDIGNALGLRKVLQTARRNPTTIVVRKDTDPELLRRFFRATNRAIEVMDQSPERFRDSYFKRLETVLDEMDLDVKAETRGKVVVPRWSGWERYEEWEFKRTYEWMRERNLAPPGSPPVEAVGSYPLDIFP